MRGKEVTGERNERRDLAKGRTQYKKSSYSASSNKMDCIGTKNCRCKHS